VPHSHWTSFAVIETRAPAALLSWLAEPGLLTARVREACGDSMYFRMLGPLRDAPLPPPLQARLDVKDSHCLLREIEFRCGEQRIIFAQTIFPATTVGAFPWLRELGEAPLGETLRKAEQPLERDPLEYRALTHDHPLALAACSDAGVTPVTSSHPHCDDTPPTGHVTGVWARRAVYRLAGHPILVQEVFLPALLHLQETH
jgi:chorismate lyase